MSIIGAAVNFQCDLCGFKTTSKGSRISHTKKEHKGRNYKCELCDYSTAKDRWSLENHIQTKHRDERPFKCDQCNYKAKAPAALRNHKAIHEGIIFRCEQCDFTDKAKYILNRHRRMQHENVTFDCHFCSF